jgi:hypothetical protein
MKLTNNDILKELEIRLNTEKDEDKRQEIKERINKIKFSYQERMGFIKK